MPAKKKVDYTKEINTDRPIERGGEGKMDELIIKQLSELPTITLNDGQMYIQLYDAMKTVKGVKMGDSSMVAKEIDRPTERGTELVSVGRLETQDAYLLDILKEQGFYLVYNKKETKFGELEYWQVLYPKED